MVNETYFNMFLTIYATILGGVWSYEQIILFRVTREVVSEMKILKWMYTFLIVQLGRYSMCLNTIELCFKNWVSMAITKKMYFIWYYNVRFMTTRHHPEKILVAPLCMNSEQDLSAVVYMNFCTHAIFCIEFLFSSYKLLPNY